MFANYLLACPAAATVEAVGCFVRVQRIAAGRTECEEREKMTQKRYNIYIEAN